ncbi:glycine zipper 2TM domain-containing protein [Sphingomonas quercus]|uniref:17 kDa surface antigen n=1 Tax=Sphingomonas quercus TaxID=2842451 RepID=A0ABS6BK87_9SPHN|nr:glycine zipper 2TM domain-containing protein [Sphingomonas quercus]MBU3078704.1 glycine zipper 2TM domain-containing protein [Sphingomonas quercus]
MRRPILLLALAASTLAAPALAQSPADQQRWDEAQARFQRETAIYEAEQQRYEASRGQYGAGRPYGDGRDGFATNYDAARYYRDGPGYQERRLSSNDEVFRGSDGRYYCKRNDGTTGLIIGGAAGGILGNVIDGGRHRTGGTLIGGALGALLGRSVDQQNTDVRCR